jgi:filamentous hemagglutinin
MNGDKSDGLGWNHVVAEHFNPTKRGKSQFSVNQNELRTILQSKEVVGAPVVRVLESKKGTRYLREVTLEGHPVGIDVRTKSATSTLTVVTDREGNLITTFPGKLD